MTPNVDPKITDIGAQSGAGYAIDPRHGGIQKIELGADDVTLSMTGLSAAAGRSVTVILTESGGPWNLDFDANWLWVGKYPTELASGAVGMLVLQAVGAAGTDVIASYQVLGDGT